MDLFGHSTTVETLRIDFDLHRLAGLAFKYDSDLTFEDYKTARMLYEQMWLDLANDLHDGKIDAIAWGDGVHECVIARSLRGHWLEYHTFVNGDATYTAYINSARDVLNKADEDGITAHIVRMGR